MHCVCARGTEFVRNLYGRHRIISSADATFSAAKADFLSLLMSTQINRCSSLHNDRTSGGEDYLLNLPARDLLAREKATAEDAGNLPGTQKCRCRQRLFEKVDGFDLYMMLQLRRTITIFVWKSCRSHYIQPGNNCPFLRLSSFLLHHLGAGQKPAVPLSRNNMLKHCQSLFAAI